MNFSHLPKDPILSTCYYLSLLVFFVMKLVPGTKISGFKIFGPKNVYSTGTKSPKNFIMRVIQNLTITIFLARYQLKII